VLVHLGIRLPCGGMEMNLAGRKDGVSERFAPDEDAGRLIEAEHVARYRWATQLAPGRAVLDAACGTAYGARMMAAAGAREVVGIDIAEPVLSAVRPQMPDNVRLDAGDLRELPYSDDRFDLVVCFEAIEHFEDPFTVLDELVRVLAPEGLLLVSSPNRGVYQEGNPHHYHEFRPDELRAELGSRLRNVRLTRQHDYIVSALLSDEDFVRSPDAPLADLKLHKLVPGEPDGETYTIGMAGNGELPDLPSLGAMTGTLELRDWLTLFQNQSNALKMRADRIASLEEHMGEAGGISERLLDAERRLAGVPERELRIAELENQLEETVRAAEAARTEARVLDQRVSFGEQVLADVMNSPSWRVTLPLRTAKHSVARVRQELGRRGLGPGR